MKRKFVEIDANGVVVEIHDAEVKGNKGNDAKDPKTKLTLKNLANKTRISSAANKGDKWHEGKQQFLRALPKRA